MTDAPKWFKPAAIIALLWNLMGCAAYLSDVMLTPEDLAKMSAAQQALYAARPAWSVGATAIAVWGGTLGCIGLLLRKPWSFMVLLLSLAGVIAQDVALFGLGDAAVDTSVYILQGLVLLVAVGLVLLSRKAIDQGWVG
jgi:hypothetical protein